MQMNLQIIYARQESDPLFSYLIILLGELIDYGKCNCWHKSKISEFSSKYSHHQPRSFSTIILQELKISPHPSPLHFGALYQTQSKFCCIFPVSIIVSQLQSMSKIIPSSSFFFWIHLTYSFKFQPRCGEEDDFIILNIWVVFHCVSIPQLSQPVICWSTPRFFPSFNDCKLCFYEHRFT